MLTPLVLTALAALATGCNNKASPDANDPNAGKVAEAAANANFSVGPPGPGPVLALQVVLTPTAATSRDARFMRVPLRKDGGESDLMVIRMAGGRIVHKYPIADPLNAQVEPNDKGLHQTLRLPQASVWIYMPATRIDVIEISPGRNDDTLPRGGRLDMAAVLGRLCPNQPRIEDCAQRAVAATPTEPGDDVQSPTLPLPPPKGQSPT
jgi:hypothetical protein